MQGVVTKNFCKALDLRSTVAGELFLNWTNQVSCLMFLWFSELLQENDGMLP
jgi:hypothetical protein